MHPRVKKWLVRPLIIITSLLCALVTVGFIVLSTQQEKLVNLAVGELNKQFKGEITIEGSTIALFKNFPYVSVALHNTRFYADKTKKGNPIATIDKLYAGFSIRDILNQKYDIKQLLLQGGNVDLIQEKDGTVNLIEAQHVADVVVENKTDKSSNTSIHLQRIVVNDMRISFLDKVSGRRFKTDIDKLVSSFVMDSSRLSLTLNSNLKLDVATGTDTALFRDKELQLALTAAYLLDSKRFEFSKCTVKLQEADFNVTGYANLSDTTYVNFRVKGEKNDFNLFTAFLPANVKEILTPFQYNGKLYFDALIKGNASNDRLPLIQASFGCREAWFINTTANKKVDQLGFQGYYTNGEAHNLKTSELRILNVTARPEKGIFKGHFAVRDFTNPKAIVQMNSQLELNFLGEFLGIHDLKQTTGTIKLDIDFKEVHDIPLPEASLQKLKEGV